MESLVGDKEFEMSLEEYEENFYMQRQRKDSGKGKIRDKKYGVREHMGSI